MINFKRKLQYYKGWYIRKNRGFYSMGKYGTSHHYIHKTKEEIEELIQKLIK